MKRDNHRDRLLALLRDGAWHTMREMERHGGMRYGARLWEIVRECAECGWPEKEHAQFGGESWCPAPHPFAVFRPQWTYEKRNVGEDVWEYRLISCVTPKQLTFV